jgi:nucleoside 2-deoxyribosyltransferase
VTADPWEDPGFKAYAKRCREKLIPMIEQSGTAISIVPPDLKADVKFATELGFMIMLDKPIIAMVPPGTKVPLKLAKVCDEIVEGDINDPTVKDRMMQAIRRQQEKLGDD